jgi:Tfp pilus assembly protein PilZ
LISSANADGTAKIMMQTKIKNKLFLFFFYLPFILKRGLFG